VSGWSHLLLIAAASIVFRIVLALIGRWVAPRPLAPPPTPAAASPADLPPRPPLGDYLV